MEKRLILRGVIAGAVGGVLAFVFARIFAEPLVQKAIDYEEGRGAAEERLAGVGAHEHGEVFSRTVQENLGIGLALVLFGIAMGALFAVAYAICLGRVGRVRARPLALLVAGAAFVSVYLVPFLKYPTNPPAVGNDDTIRMRSALYLVLTGASVILLVLAAWLGRRLQARFGNWNASLLAGGAYVAAVAVLFLLLPSLGDLAANKDLHQSTETPPPLTDADGTIVFPGFPADVLYGFRLYAIGGQLLMWTAIGLVFGPMAEKLLERPPAVAEQSVTA
ncbi:CbtA family protein [Dactylosporangium fulvum]|uniref:CbtA family protein n=1 Tax=Dactylosporangium fulvum TaxID=53359 RepID=A0ABY5VUK2_9ACTN|nr:CbtA family protein [Dactylosporangium fulvum]UWP80940.1 CbtA family protein [Dactylosporangium fulvum]